MFRKSCLQPDIRLRLGAWEITCAHAGILQRICPAREGIHSTPAGSRDIGKDVECTDSTDALTCDKRFLTHWRRRRLGCRESSRTAETGRILLSLCRRCYQNWMGTSDLALFIQESSLISCLCLCSFRLLKIWAVM